MADDQHKTDDLQVFAYGAEPRKVRRGEILQQPGNRVSGLFLVRKGLLRSYSIDSSGKVHIFMFAPEGWMISDVQAQAFNEPAELFIEALEDSEIIEMSQHQINAAFNDPEALQLAISKMTRRLSVLQKRIILLMSATAQERYEHFMETYPQLINRVPQKMIASYLGMTPEALSTIRSKSIRKGSAE